MQCPVCKVALVMSDRNGIEIDYCPQCRGVWLDRGELDKIIERGSASAPQGQPQQFQQAPQFQQQPQQQYQQHHRDYDDDDDDHHRKSYDNHHGHKKHKKEGFLGDLFDF